MKDKTIERAKGLLAPALVLHTNIIAKKALGVYVHGADGKRYMDFSSGLATVNIGHNHPSVVKAAKEQTERFIHSGCIFRYDSIVTLALRLKEKTPEGLDMFFFSNSGAEAIEGAIKLCRFVTKRPAIIAFTGGFHGRTLGALSLTSSNVKYRRRYHPLLPSVYHVPYPYCYRCPVGQNPESCSIECFKVLESALEHLVSPEEVACVVMEPVLGEGGYVVPPVRYVKKLRELTKRHGILFVADEVQSGFGRTGKWFASEHFGAVPDVMAVGKGIASGFPLSAVIGRKDIMKKWPPGAHGTTFGGNPVSCAAAIATIDVMEKQGLADNAKRQGDYALKRLRVLRGKFPSIGDVRGLGLMIGIEFVKKDKKPDSALLKRIMKRCEKNGLIVVECGLHKNVLRFIPPLTITTREMDAALGIFEKALKSET